MPNSGLITLYSKDASWDNFIEFRSKEYVSELQWDASQDRGAIYNEMFMATGNVRSYNFASPHWKGIKTCKTGPVQDI